MEKNADEMAESKNEAIIKIQRGAFRAKATLNFLSNKNE